MVFPVKLRVFALAMPLCLYGQINIAGVSTSATQAILQYTSPVANACSLQVADMARSIAISSGSQAGGRVTIQTVNPHGLLAGAVIYIENSGVNAWNGWQAVTSTPALNSLTFANATNGTAAQGNVGVLVDDVNPTLFPGADQDSRPGNVTTGQSQTTQAQILPAGGGRSRTFVVGLRYAQVASDGSRYSRALQANTRHHYTLTCGSQTFDNEFHTQNIPLGDTHNEGIPADRNNPGQFPYPTVQWSNNYQSLIDPVSGLRSRRMTAPEGIPSPIQTFVSALDLNSAWQNPTAPLNNTGGAAMFTGPCSSGTCALLLRADNLVISGGATYTALGSSLDWLTVTFGQASISNAACSGDDCKIVSCLTVNGQTCAGGNREVSLTGTPANYTLGTQNLMDLWQASGTPGISRVDVSQATGTVNYSAATKRVTLAGGSPFNIKWTAGSRISIGGTEYAIASVQSELQVTLAAGPVGDASGATYSANNFGVLVWKKTATADRVSIGYTTYLYGSSANPGWLADAISSCSSLVNTPNGPGYNCLFDHVDAVFGGVGELFWIAADGSDVRDLGEIATSYYGPNYYFGQGRQCGVGSTPYQWDPADGTTWYCMYPVNSLGLAIVKGHYSGTYSRYTPGQQVPDCATNGSVQPCIQFTVMQPGAGNVITASGPNFNPDFAASGYPYAAFGYNTVFGGVSADGDLLIYTRTAGQDTIGWQFIYTLGDRTPTGTDANSFRIVAAASSYRVAPLSWCTMHGASVPSGGWSEIQSNDLNVKGPSYSYAMTMTSAPLNTNVGVPGGLNACPTNPFGVTGQVCTAVSFSGEPLNNGDGTFLQNVQVGDVLEVDSGSQLEEMRVLTITASNQYVVQRAYGGTPASTHANTTFNMACGTRNAMSFPGAATGLWNYRADPYGANASGTTIINDPQATQGHGDPDGGPQMPNVTLVAGGGFGGGLPQTACPSSLVSDCDSVRPGWLAAAVNQTAFGIVTDPQFAGVTGLGSPNQVDTHPGPCFNGWCMDARPMDGGTSWMVNAFVQVTGQLWKSPGNAATLHRKILSTMAYVGRAPLVDISGPSSVIAVDSTNSYQYCYANVAGECYAGSAVGDIYLNAPYVSYPYCSYPGIANQGDDTNSVCIADLGPYTGNLAQLGYLRQDLVGAGIRRLGPNFARWNQFDVFWNSSATPNGSVLTSRVRWLEGIRYEDLLTFLPPYPQSDGVTRSTFLPVSVTIDPPVGLPAQTAVVEFGYAENGQATSFYCTSRQETCVAVGAAINQASPFYFEQTETYTGVPCSTGCTIAVPALSQHVLYYRWKYLSGAGQVVGSSEVHVVVTP